MTRVIDLSLTHENYASEPFGPVISRSFHKEGARRLATLAKVDPDDFPEGLGLASETVTASTHAGTHIDAPFHFGPICAGEPAKTIDEIPLEWCFGPGVVLDFRHLAPGSQITTEDVQGALRKIDYTLKAGDVVLIQTGADKYWGTSKYLGFQSGLGLKATEYILDQGIKIIGIDGWGLDRPVAKMAEAYHAGEQDALWPSHFLGRKREYLQIEKLANLDQLPRPTGFTVYAFPVKIDKGSGGWTRAVAIVED